MHGSSKYPPHGIVVVVVVDVVVLAVVDVVVLAVVDVVVVDVLELVVLVVVVEVVVVVVAVMKYTAPAEIEANTMNNTPRATAPARAKGIPSSSSSTSSFLLNSDSLGMGFNPTVC